MTNEIIQQYFKLHEDFSALKELISEGVKTVQDQHGGEVHEFERHGKKVKINERTLWEEIYHMGLKGHEAADFLRNKYPDVFENIDKSEELGKEIKMFEITNLGFSFTEMNGANLIKLVRALLKLEMSTSTWTSSFSMGDYDKLKKGRDWMGKIKNFFIK